jgi:hypothetical protein
MTFFIVFSFAGNEANVTRTVTVVVPVLTSLSLSSSTTTLNVGETTELTLMGTYSDNTSKTVTQGIVYVITPSSSVEVNSTVLTAKKDGNVTLQAKVGNTLSNVLKLNITWVVNGHVLPPEPDKTLNDSTLLGIDVNDNGVRDDVERWIYENYEEPIERGIFMQSARAYNLVIVDPSNAKEAIIYSDNALSCTFYWFRHKSSPIDRFRNYEGGEKLESLQFNTLDRHISYDRYNKVLSGGVYDLPSADKTKCEFDSNGVLGELK